MTRWLFLILLAPFTLAPFAAAAPLAPQRAVAITLDDLPFASVPSEDDAYLEQMTERLLQGLQSARVPAIGFVNEAKLMRDGSQDPARVELLRGWLRAGFELGNHTATHPSLDRVPLDVFEADVLAGETVTRPLMEHAGRTLRWFRHPFLHRGQTAETGAALQTFLTAHGYTAAPVTVNSAEWVFAAAYARAEAQGETETAQRIAAAYVPYMQAVFAQAENLALDLFGRPIAHVLVLHASALNADHFGALAAMLTQRGYRFVSLDDALKDTAYTLPAGYSGVDGESWLECWSRQAGLRPPPLPPVPGFVTQWAGSAALRGY